jgi:hypothetical protein
LIDVSAVRTVRILSGRAANTFLRNWAPSFGHCREEHLPVRIASRLSGTEHLDG